MILSPFFAEVILGVAECGSKNETNQEIITALRFPYNPKDAEAGMRTFIPLLTSSEYYQIYFFSKMYVEKAQTTKRELRSIAKKVFQSDVENIDFTKQEVTANCINKSLKEYTKNRIENIVSVLPADTKMVLLSAVGIKGRWLKPFQKGPSEQNFFITKKKVVKVELMQNVGTFNYFENESIGAKFLELRLDDETLSMVVVLPFDLEGLSHVETHMDQVFLGHSFALEHVKVDLPKFRLENSINFKPVLESMGMELAFTNQADFSRAVTGHRELFLNEVTQKTFISVSENGLDAPPLPAEWSGAVGVYPAIKTKLFLVDHPFLFFIRLKDLVVFTGRVLYPTS